jgi:hypothetical protein
MQQRVIELISARNPLQLIAQLREISHYPETFFHLHSDCEETRTAAAFYFKGRADQLEELKEEVKAKNPAKPLHVWKVTGYTEYKIWDDAKYNTWDDRSLIKNRVSKSNYYFEIFPGDNGGFFARCVDNKGLATEADDLAELKDNIITLVRNYSEEE